MTHKMEGERELIYRPILLEFSYDRYGDEVFGEEKIIIIGYKGDTHMDAGYICAPYIPFCYIK